jgi:hypothetical protein
MSKLLNITDGDFYKFLEFGKKNAEQKRRFNKNKKEIYITLLKGFDSGTLSIKDLKQGIKKEPEYYKDILKDLRTFNLLNNNM